MKKQVENFLKDLGTKEQMKNKFTKAQNDPKEFANLIAPYLDGLSTEEFINELKKEKEKSSSKMNMDELDQVSGGAITGRDVILGINIFSTLFNTVIDAAGTVAGAVESSKAQKNAASTTQATTNNNNAQQ